MREIFVSELVKDILGPRDGINEIMHVFPKSEYLTGILQPHEAGLETDPDDQGGEEKRGSSGEGDFDQDEDVFTLRSPSLDPKSFPSSMGLSFTTKFEGTLNFKICLTWARYKKNNADNTYPREPHFAVLEVKHDPSDKQFFYTFDENGTQIDGKYGVHLRGILTKTPDNQYLVSIYFVNQTEIKQTDEEKEKHESKKPKLEDFIFQPQIRVVCFDGTQVVPTVITNIENDEEEMMDVQYSEKKFLARGHMTSAVWKEIDPQREFENAANLDYPEAAKDIPFEWIDGKQLDDPEQQKMFSLPDVRTEYVPMYSIPSPDMNWDVSYGPEPVFEPSLLAEKSNPEEMENALRPLYDGYKKWIEGLANDPTFQTNPEMAEKIVSKCNSVLKRIDASIKMLSDPANTEITLAFCFANKAIDLQFSWNSKNKGKTMKYRPFQLGFILMSLESIARSSSESRDICDLMWVPTGGGKTEAYLMLVAFVIAYRRRLGLAEGSPMKGIGTAVLTRYTLRLLTIQQFRRTLSVITACEFLRVSSSDSGTIGWRPNLSDVKSDFLWGSSQFSLGLWIGGTMTPNHLVKGDDDAISILKNKTDSQKEPAQILNCPCCRAILSVPSTKLPSGEHKLFFTVKTDNGKSLEDTVASLETGKSKAFLSTPLHILNPSVTQNSNPEYFTISITVFRPKEKISGEQIDNLWDLIGEKFKEASLDVRLVPFRASRLGYFERFHLSNERQVGDDFEIYCPNPNCDLKKTWFAGTPTGSIHNNAVKDHTKTNQLKDKKLPDKQMLVDVQDAFQVGGDRNISDRIPIPAFTIDDQVYSKIPSVIVSTVDKFAAPSFNEQSTTIFGNADQHHPLWGFASKYNVYDLSFPDIFEDVDMPDPPELIIQDELHLIDGPLGSMVGLYETAVDQLCSQTKKPKIIASTATIKKAPEHIQSVFSKKTVDIFPPNGMNVGKRFFVTENDAHPLDDITPNVSGRLYLGVTAPGKGPITPLKNVFARLSHSSWQHHSDNIQNIAEKIDPFWTEVVYFNAMRELAGGVALFRQDIKERMNTLARSYSPTPEPRKLGEPLELSGRTGSSELPGILETLETKFDGKKDNLSPDSLFTTSMFGTGVDIDRLGLMIINGQTKTTASYIQSSGRVGRSKPGLIVTMLRSTRPRDLSHYEFFNKYHRQLHRFVEAPSVYPFASGVLDKALGPMLVFILRHMRETAKLRTDLSAILMDSHRLLAPVQNLSKIIAARESSQPDTRKLPSGTSIQHTVAYQTESKLDSWKSLASQYDKLRYKQFVSTHNQNITLDNVVLGDEVHQAKNSGVRWVYENAPTSLRSLEPETSFEIYAQKNAMQNVRPSQFIYTLGPGALLEGREGSVVILSTRNGLFDSNRDLYSSRMNFTINDDRMSKNLLDGNTIFRLPTVTELPELQERKKPIYLTNPFPLWSLCPYSFNHKSGSYILYRGRTAGNAQRYCPECHALDQREAEKNGGGKQAVRFVMACPSGHLDEVDWDFLVHGKEKHNSEPPYFLYKNPEGGINDIKIECPICHKEGDFGRAYTNPKGIRTCTGRYPEREEHHQFHRITKSNCDKRMTIIQKSSANLRIPQTETLVSIRSGLSSLHFDFMDPAVRNPLRLEKKRAEKKGTKIDKDDLDFILTDLVDDGQWTESRKNSVLSLDWKKRLEPIINEVTMTYEKQTYSELLVDEFDALMEGSNTGIPEPSDESTTFCKMIPSLNRTFECDNGMKLRVCPVTKLSTITVQKGYTREPKVDDDPNSPNRPTPVEYTSDIGERLPSGNNRDRTTWFPGVVNHGEGLFIRLDSDDWHPELTGKAPAEWLKTFSSGGGYRDFSFRDKEQKKHDELHPVFVWWHTLSHLLIRAIGEDAGFSSSAIQERVYLQVDGDKARGGILLYSTQSGGDGSMGGLLALAPYFDRMLEIAMQNLHTCSGDPLCSDKEFFSGELNGACCFGCTMNSETSCEYRNYWLDRHVLTENSPCSCKKSG
tara:strand:- start:2806 stop:8760 length:5955 start_codon:yes stop_codon:yes gene_type:complete